MISLFVSLILAFGTAEVNQAAQFTGIDSISELTKTIVGTVGGWVHAIDSRTHEKIWSVYTGSPLLSSHVFEGNQREYSVIPLPNGDLVFRGPEGYRTTSINAKALTENTPFRSNDGLFYVGKKTSVIYEINSVTGAIEKVYGDSESSQTISSPPVTTSPNTFLLGRTDYEISAFDTTTKRMEFNLTHGAFMPMDSMHGGYESSSTKPTHVPRQTVSGFCKSEVNHVDPDSDSSTGTDKDCLSTSSGSYSESPYGMTLLTTPDGQAALAFPNGFTSAPFQLDSPATMAFRVDSSIISAATTGRSKGLSPAVISTSDIDEQEDYINIDDATYSMDFIDTDSNIIEYPDAGSGGITPVDVLYGQALPIGCNEDLLPDGEEYERQYASDDQDSDNMALTVAPRKDLVPATPQARSSSLSVPIIDESSGNYVFIKQMPGGGSYAIEVGAEDFAPVARRSSRFTALVDGDSFPGEFCERRQVGIGVDAREALDEDGSPLLGDNCPVNNSKANVTRLPAMHRRSAPMPGLFHYVAQHYTDLLEAVADGEEAMELLFLLLDLIRSLLWVTLQMFAIVLLVGALVAGGLTSTGVLRGDVRQVLLRLIATPTDKSPKPVKPEGHHTSGEVVVSATESGIQIDKLEVLYSCLLGKGSNGTMVYRGTFESRPVAVKRMLSAFQNVIEKEVDVLKKVDNCYNIVRYYQTCCHADFHYLILELCDMSLWDFVDREKRIKRGKSQEVVENGAVGSGPSWQKDAIDQRNMCRDALRQIASGILTLHSKSIIHRDIKPHNILLKSRKSLHVGGNSPSSLDSLSSPMQSFAETEDDVLELDSFDLKISDMGLSREQRVDSELSSFHMHASSTCSHFRAGTLGWAAPELYARVEADGSVTDYIAMDIFSLGCVFYFLMNPGSG